MTASPTNFQQFLPGLRVIGFLALLGTPFADSLAGEADSVAALPAVLPTPRIDPARSAAVTQALSDKDALELAIAQLETTHGAYGAELSEAYYQLGSTERTLENYEDAVAAFGKALQALRTGYGLHDLRQLPILEELLATSEALTDWEEADSLRHLIHYITTKSPEADQELRIRSLVELGHWKLKAEKEDLLPEKAESVSEALKLYQNEIGLLEAGESYQGKNIHLATLYLDLAAIELGLAKKKYEMPISEFGVEGQSSTSTVTCITYMTRDGRPMQSCTTQEIPNPNYYMAPSNKKNMEIRDHLDEVKEDVMQAYYALQNEVEGTPNRFELLAEVQRLTQEYNEFSTMNSRSSIYRLD